MGLRRDSSLDSSGTQVLVAPFEDEDDDEYDPEWRPLGHSREPLVYPENFRWLVIYRAATYKAAALQTMGAKQTPMELTYTLKPDPTPEERYGIIDPLIAYNEAEAGPSNRKEFAFVVRSETGEFVGGLLGMTHWNHFFVSSLYVDPRFRKEGIGRELMARAEALAREQGCDAINLDTFDFQAPGFYEKLGFTVFGKLEDYPPGHQRFYLVKRLRERRANKSW